MLARRRAIQHPTAGRIDLPLLVPAFSSKGFALRGTGNGKKRRFYSEVAYELDEFAKRQQRSVLVSAFDIFHGRFHAPELPRFTPQRYLRNSALVFLDSGGYELSDDFDSSEPRIFPHQASTFTKDDYLAVLEAFAKPKTPPPLVIANYDHSNIGKPIAEQIREARELFRQYPSFATDFILKPWKRDQSHIDPADLSDNDIGDLAGFDIIGVAEKDLSRNLFEKIRRIATLRRRLDQQQIATPIHIWGGLEPLATPLFFFAGAEIFDGISWLRYAFRNGVGIIRETYSVVSSLGITAPSKTNHFHASIENLVALTNLTIALEQWVELEGQDWSMFHPDIKEQLRTAYGVMRSKGVT